MIAKLFVFIAALGLVSAVVDLERSITRIRTQIAVTSDPAKAPKWNELPAIIEAAIPCLGSLSLFKVETDRLPSSLKQFIEHLTPISLAHDLLQVDWDEVSAKRSIKPNGLQDDLKEFMQKEEFVRIHKQIWTSQEAVEFVDVRFKNIHMFMDCFMCSSANES